MDLPNGLTDRHNATAVEKQFVRKYKKLPYLWNPHHPDYNNRSKRNAGYDALLPIFRQYMPQATRFHVRQKINILRSCYRKERRKILASGRMDDYGNLVYTYVPNVWKYHAMKFLDEEVENDEIENDETETEYVEDEIEYVDTQDPESGNDEPDTSKLETPIYLEEDQFDDSIEDHKPFKIRRSQNSLSQSYQENFSYRESDVLEKEFNAIGANVACKLQRMTTQQRYRAELLINKVLIKGLKESLTEATDLTEMWNMQIEGSNYIHTDDTQHMTIIKGSSKDSNNTSTDQVFDLSEN